MTLFYDLGIGAFVVSPTNRTILSSISITRGDTPSIKIIFCQSRVVVDYTAGATGRLSIKLPTQFSGEDPLAAATSWTKTGSGTSAVYTFPLSLQTAGLNKALVQGAIEDVVADQESRFALTGLLAGDIIYQVDSGIAWTVVDPAATGTDAGWYRTPQVKTLPLLAEIEITVGSDITTLPILAVTLANDLIKPTDGSPVLVPDMKATQADAEAGTDNVHWMTPLRVAQAIAALASGGGNPFDQSLNTTDEVAFKSLSAVDYIHSLGGLYTDNSGLNADGSIYGLSLTLPNSTALKVGSFDNGTGGANGIGLLCAVGYELNWQGGRLRSISAGDTEGTPVQLYIDSPIYAPSVNFGGSDSLYDDSGLQWGSQSVAMIGMNVSNFTNDAWYATEDFVNNSGFLYWGSNISSLNNDAGYSTFSPSGTVAYQGDNISNFTNDAGYLTSISGLNISSLYNDAGYFTFSPSGTVAYQGDNISEFTNDVGYLTSISGLNISSLYNDAGYSTFFPSGTVAYQGDSVSGFTNDCGYLTSYSYPNFYNVVGWGGTSGNISSLNPDGTITVGSYWTNTPNPIALRPDGSASFAGGGVIIDSNGNTILGNLSMGGTAYGFSGTNLIAAGATFGGAGEATISSSGVLAVNNAVSSSTDNVVTNKVEIVINGITYYLLATTAAS